VDAEQDESIPRKTIGAQELFLDLLKERAETGRIYIMNIDHCNSHSSYLDKVNMSNLCVAGDTKIKIRYPEPQAPYNHDEKRCNWGIFEAVIDIEALGFYIEDRDSDIERCKVSSNQIPQIEVLSYNIETGEEEWKPITAFAETSPKAKVMKITDEETGKSIVVTPEHKVFTKNRGYVMAKDLVETDELVIN
jgi:ribonucleotide reductase alpha subunit